MNERLEARRRVAVPATAMALIVSLIGGLLVLMMPVKPPTQVALKPIPPAIPAAPAPAPEPEQPPMDLSMFGFGDSGAELSPTPQSSQDDFGGAAAFAPSGGGGLPAFQLPAAPSLPAGTPIDWGALLAPLIQAQANAQAANVAGSVTGSVVGTVSSVINSAAIVIGDLLLLAAVSNNGPNILSELQGALDTALPAAAAAAFAAGVPQLPVVPDLTGLTAAFSAAAGAPPLGVPALPLPQLPPLPTPEQIAASIAGLSALGALPALPPIALPGLPPPPGLPQLPRPEEVVGGLVGGAIAIGVGGAILGAIFQPPSITRMLGLPF